MTRNGRPTSDTVIYKIRYARPELNDSEVVYRSTAEAAYAFAHKHFQDGTLLFFGKFRFQEEIRFEKVRA